MATQTTSASEKLVIDPKWRRLPMILLVVGGIGGLIGAFVNTKQFSYSYLLAFMFFLSICLGSLFLVILHHLFDASWSVPIRRFLEHIACLAPVMLVLFIPVLLFAPAIYRWMTIDPQADHALQVKSVLFNRPV